MIRPFLSRLLLYLLLVSNPAAGGEDVLPASGDIPGWTRSGEPVSFSGDELFGHINGGAEIFHEYGFRSLEVARYVWRNGSPGEITLEVYRMASGAQAFGLFSIKRTGREAGIPGIQEPHWISSPQANLIKGDKYVNILSFEAAASDLETFLRDMSARLPGRADIPSLVGQLPEAELIPGSPRFIQGRLAARETSVLLADPIWDFEGGRPAVAGRYNPANSMLILIDCENLSPDLQPRMQVLFEDNLDSVENRGGILTGKNSTGKFFLFVRGNRLAALLLGEENEAAALGRLSLTGITPREWSPSY